MLNYKPIHWKTNEKIVLNCAAKRSPMRTGCQSGTPKSSSWTFLEAQTNFKMPTFRRIFSPLGRSDWWQTFMSFAVYNRAVRRTDQNLWNFTQHPRNDVFVRKLLLYWSSCRWRLYHFLRMNKAPRLLNSFCLALNKPFKLRLNSFHMLQRRGRT